MDERMERQALGVAVGIALPAGSPGVAFERLRLSPQGALRPQVPQQDAQSRAVNRCVVGTGLQ